MNTRNKLIFLSGLLLVLLYLTIYCCIDSDPADADMGSTSLEANMDTVLME